MCQTPTRRFSSASFDGAATIQRNKIQKKEFTVTVGPILNDSRFKDHSVQYLKISGFSPDFEVFNKKNNHDSFAQNDILLRGHGCYEPSRDPALQCLKVKVFPTVEYINRAYAVIKAEVPNTKLPSHIDLSGTSISEFTVYLMQISNLLGSETGIGILGDDVIEPFGLLFINAFPHHFTERVINLTNGGNEISGIVSKVPIDVIDLTSVAKFFTDFGIQVQSLNFDIFARGSSNVHFSLHSFQTRRQVQLSKDTIA